MKVALVHDWLTGMRGGERCLEAFVCLYPGADIFTLVHSAGSTSPEIDKRVVATSYLSKFPGVRRYYRLLLPLFPSAVRGLDLSGYDLIISLSHAAAKNVRVPPGVPHICYCFTPMRYVWDQVPHYFGPMTAAAATPLLSYLRAWDKRGAAGITHFVGISTFVAARIRRFYGRDAAVIHPPVRMANDAPRGVSGDGRLLFAKHAEPFFLCAGALVPYKRIDVAVAAFASVKADLWVTGTGSELAKLRRIATPNVKFIGSVDDATLWECYRRCRALVFPGIEDFGIIPVECLASGKPVVGLNAGGLKESVNGLKPWAKYSIVPSSACGVMIPKKDYGRPEGLVQAIHTFFQHENEFCPDVARHQAARFSYPEFFRSWARFSDQVGIDAGSSPIFSPGSVIERNDAVDTSRSLVNYTAVVGRPTVRRTTVRHKVGEFPC